MGNIRSVSGDGGESDLFGRWAAMMERMAELAMAPIVEAGRGLMMGEDGISGGVNIARSQGGGTAAAGHNVSIVHGDNNSVINGADGAGASSSSLTSEEVAVLRVVIERIWGDIPLMGLSHTDEAAVREAMIQAAGQVQIEQPDRGRVRTWLGKVAELVKRSKEPLASIAVTLLEAEAKKLSV